MSIDNGQNFEVLVEEFAERHFIKQFRKKYRNAWETTERALIAELQRVDNVLGNNDYINIIKNNCEFSLVKLYFKIAGTTESKKTSGDRAIVFINIKTKICRVLMVYSKNDISPPNETQKWLTIVKNNYPDIWKVFKP